MAGRPACPSGVAMTTRPKCPSCGSGEVVPIAYGMPGPQMWDEYERGEIALGGCMPRAENRRCRSCEFEFG
jgi:hypothetical protein